MKTVKFRIGNMRKEVEWVVYPQNRTASENDPTLFVQSDKRALGINLRTKKGMLSNGKGHPGFHTVSKFMGATEVDVSDDIIALCNDAQAKTGDMVGAGGIVRIR